LTIAEGLLEHGAAGIALLDLDEKEGQHAVEKLHSLYPEKRKNIVFQPVDVTDADASGRLSMKLLSLLER
jgi:NAD(P)-dependent dehydrogenase (short-subunit alcohol dehydrogenase family)